MVKKLLQQRKRTGEIAARHAYSGRKPMIVQAHEKQMRIFLGRKPDMTLKELREPWPGLLAACDSYALMIWLTYRHSAL